MAFGKATLSLTQLARSSSISSASPTTASDVTWPLWGMLSQDITVNGTMPSSRRRISPARISPNTVFGAADIPGVGHDVGMSRVEFPGRRVDEIAAFGDGQRHDADRRICKLLDDISRVARRQKIDHHAGDARLPVPGILLDDGRQPVLLLKLRAARFFAIEYARADDRPVMPFARIEQIVEIDRLVRAMEIADAEMQDAGP